MAMDWLDEAARMREFPGRRAIVAGSGVDVWDVIATWKTHGTDFDLLRQSYPWLTEAQLRAVVSYYEAYPHEIETRLEREEQWTPERVWQEQPFSKPGKTPG